MHQWVLYFSSEIKKPAVAQHAFIQSINLDNANPVPWTNLGTLYLELGYIDLANKAFSAAQRLDHDYTRCWVGQVRHCSYDIIYLSLQV